MGLYLEREIEVNEGFSSWVRVRVKQLRLFVSGEKESIWRRG